jgi:hypothetical protein
MPSEKKPKEKRIQSRQWQVIAPADWRNDFFHTFECFLEDIKQVSQHWWFVRHDKDVDEFGVPKKPHWHLLFSFGSPRDLNTVMNYFKKYSFLLPNSYERIGSLHWAKRYLVHADDPQKAQYNFSDVETNDENYKDMFISRLGKVAELVHVEDFFKNVGGCKTFWEFLEPVRPQLASVGFAQKINLIMNLRRYYDYYYGIEKAVEVWSEETGGYVTARQSLACDTPYDYKSDPKYKEEIEKLPF